MTPMRYITNMGEELQKCWQVLSSLLALETYR
jgi:hypothetical protein